MSDQKNSFTIDTYFIISVVAGVCYIILRKFWDNWRHSRNFRNNRKRLDEITESIKSIMEGIDDVKSKDLSELRILLEELPKSIKGQSNENIQSFPQSISVEMQTDLE